MKRLLAFILFCAPLAHGAISVVQCVSAENASSSVGPIALNGVTAGNAIWFVGMSKNGTGTSALSWTGLTANILDSQSQSNFRLEQNINLNVTGGNYSISASQVGGATDMSAGICEISGLSNSGQPDGHTNSGAVQTSPPISSGSLTNTAANAIFMTAVAAYNGSVTWSVNSSFTVPTNGLVNLGFLAFAYKIVSSAAANNPQWSNNGTAQFLYADIVSLKAAAVVTGARLRGMVVQR